ncbi:MAG: hypothetical protein WCT18_01645 [Patescibacteria group bacterium]
MTLDLLYKQFEKVLNEVLPSLALLQNHGIPMKELKEKIMTLFEQSRKTPRGEDLVGVLSHVSYFLHGWLYYEKNIEDEMAHEFCDQINEILLEKMKDSSEKSESLEPTKETNIIPLFRK